MAHTKKEPFRKRIYSPGAFQADLRQAVENMDRFRQAHRAGRVDHAFAERIMLAVTQVNGCRYCAFGHARAALHAGVSQEEIRQLMDRDWQDLPEEQVPALLFAQHYAESGGHPDEAAWQTLVDSYGNDTAEDILAHIRMITMGNLLGNTFDALLSRIKGIRAQGSSVWKEIGVLLGMVTLPYHLLRASLSGKESSSAVPPG